MKIQFEVAGPKYSVRRHDFHKFVAISLTQFLAPLLLLLTFLCLET